MAISTNTWLHATNSGTGSGTVNYTVDTNTSPTARSGILTIADKTFQVDQAGAPAPPPTLGAALGNTNLVWLTGPDYPWTVTSAPTFDGVAAAMSGNRYVANSSSQLQTTVVGPGMLSFWWKVDCLAYTEPDGWDLDHFEFDIGGVVQDQIAGTVDWNYRSYALPSGTNVLTWRYTKDDGYNSGYDRAWLDQVAYAANPRMMQGQVLTGGGFHLTFSGPEGQTYKVLASADLLLPVANWTVLTSGTFGATPATFTDTSAANHARRFYRILSP